MTFDFYPVTTKDGSLGLFNNSVDDIYHSSIGAYTEAKIKFVEASGIKDLVKNNSYVRILDVCYGLGYNSKAAISEILSINPDCRIHIDCLEIDPNVLTLSCLINSDFIDYRLSKHISTRIAEYQDISSILPLFYNDVSFKDHINPKIWLFLRRFLNRKHNSYKNMNLKAKKHNIYYRTLSYRNKTSFKRCNYYENVNLKFYIEDARTAVQGLNIQYDYIFHDGFTPSKLPTLWSVEFFKELHRLLKNNGNITTYSSSAAIRSGMIEAGFYIGNGETINQKSFGTIAYKDKSLIKYPLNEKESGLLETKAGIPYYDSNLDGTTESILRHREELVQNSSRIPSSKFLKASSFIT